MDSHRNDDDGVFIKKSGITKLLDQIKTMKQELAAKDEKMREFTIAKEIEQDEFLIRIKALELKLELMKKAQALNDEKNYQAQIQKLQADLKQKARDVDFFTAEISALKQQMDSKNSEIQRLKVPLSNKTVNQHDQIELNKTKQNFTELQTKHLRVTTELSKYNAMPVFKQILTTKELLEKFEDKISKTKISPANAVQITEKLRKYQTEVEEYKSRNAKLQADLTSRHILAGGEYYDEITKKLELDIEELRKQNADDVGNQLKKTFQIAHSVANLSAKLNKFIPDTVTEVAEALKVQENEFNALKMNSFQWNFEKQEKKYVELLMKLKDVKILFDSLLLNAPEVKKAKPKMTATGRAEDLFLKARDSNDNGSEGAISLNDLKKKCSDLYDKYNRGELPKVNSKDEAGSSSKATGWTFDHLDNN